VWAGKPCRGVIEAETNVLAASVSWILAVQPRFESTIRLSTNCQIDVTFFPETCH